MALLDYAWYVDSVGHAAVTAWATGASVSVGALRRQNAAPSAGNERVFICVVAGTTHATTEPTWTVTRGAKTTDNTVTWQECTGQPAVNEATTSSNTPTWNALRTFTAAGTLGQIIKNTAGTHLFICTTAGTMSALISEPSWNTTTGNTTADSSATWTCIGAVNSFSNNGAPHIRIANALATNWTQAGNKVFIKSSHDYSAAVTLSATGVGTTASPNYLLCHNGGAYPPADANLTTGAKETSTTAGNSALGGLFYAYGIEWVMNNASANLRIGSGSTQGSQHYKNCKFTLLTGTVNWMETGVSSILREEFENCEFAFSNAGQQFFAPSGPSQLFYGCSFTGTMPTNMMQATTGMPGCAEFRGCDFSAAGSGKTIVPAETFTGLLRFVDCKMGASVTLAGTPTVPTYRVEFINCNSGAVNYDLVIYEYSGTLTTETTVVRTGGASDGTTPVAWKVVTTTNCKWEFPFVCPKIEYWNEATGSSITITVEGAWLSGFVPTDEDIWLEVEYLGSASFPVSSFANDGKTSVLNTGTGQASSSEVWGGSPTPTGFKLSVSVTPQMKGFIYATVKCGKLSSTFYIDPKVTIT